MAQADGTFTLDGKHGGWQSLAAVLSHAKDQAGRKRSLARMVAVASSDGVTSLSLLPGTLMGTGLVAAAAEENGYVHPHLVQRETYHGNCGSHTESDCMQPAAHQPQRYDSSGGGNHPGGGGGRIHTSTLAGFDDDDMDI